MTEPRVSASELQRLYEIGSAGAPGRPSSNGLGDSSAIGDLAALPPLEYDRVRKEEAERLGVRVDTLDREVARQRGTSDDSSEGFALTDPVPFPQPVEGAGLLDLLAQIIRKHVVLAPSAADAVALWIVHTHAHDAADISPIAAITSPTPECGKTTLLALIGLLVPKPVQASNITPAALFRTVEKFRPTLLIDEADTFLKDSDELRGVVNSGHNRANAFVIRTTGDDHEPRRFSTWAAKAIALIGRLPPTIESRSIHIELRRLTIGETVSRLRAERTQGYEPLRRMAWRWARDNSSVLRSADPELPKGVGGRAADNWRPLIAIADAAGGEWPRARLAAEALSANRSEQSAGVMLLDDIRRLFSDGAVDRLSSIEIVQTLGAREDRPWAEWHGDRPITARQIAKLLEPFGIRPNTVRFGMTTAKGYLAADFADPFQRYLLPTEVTPSQSTDFRDLNSGKP